MGSRDQERPAGQVIDGRFRIEGVLGRGGTSVVYRAHDTEDGASVALKVLDGQFAPGSEMARRFVREARAIEEVDHPHIVRVLGSGTLQDGVPYVATELLPGETLKERLRRGPPLAVAEAVRHGIETLEGLAEAHERGIVHRDVKPANIFLHAHGSGPPTVKLLDFGMSKLPAAEGDGLTLTRTGQIVGTPHYIAPEQAGGARDVDHRTDLWATGVVLYEALTGTRPFEAEQLPALLLQIVSQRPKPVRARRPEVPEAVEQAVLRALHKSREERFAVAADMRDALAAAAGA